MLKGWTIGCELELSDCERDTQLPGRSQWDRKDYSLVNSNGIANDPLGKTWAFGGEINTAPTDSIGSQLDVIDGILCSLKPMATANYRSNLHIHLHVPGLAENVELVKRAMRYTPPFDLIDPLPVKPTDAESLVRWRRRKQSHHTVLTERQWERILLAQTPDELRRAHAPSDKQGRPQYQLVQRCGVNFLSLWDHPPQTVEFRHFCMEMSFEAMENAMHWCVAYLEVALAGGELPTPVGRFPMQPLIDLELERGYRRTSPRYHSRESIIAMLTAEGAYETVSAVHR